MVDKNRYFYEFQTALDKACEEPRVKKNRVALVAFFQERWRNAIDHMSGTELLQEGIKTICVEKPKGRKKK